MLHALLRFQRPRTIIQVGAYTGDDSLIEACRRYGHRLYMFEPNPARAEELTRKAAGAPTVEVLPMAVSNFNGTATFKIAAHDDCSSLQDFDANASRAWVHEWHPYKRFEMVQSFDVERHPPRHLPRAARHQLRRSPRSRRPGRRPPGRRIARRADQRRAPHPD